MIGKFIISLDFELHWGGAEKWDLSEKENYFLNTRKIIPELLQLFEENKIRVTWATVGFLFASSLEETERFMPFQKPTYNNSVLNYYRLFEDKKVGKNEEEDPFHFASSIIKKINKTNGQELASHTFCHYYCNEEGQKPTQFEADLKAAQLIALEKFDAQLKSLVFPRNQYNASYLEIAKNQGIRIVRSNPDVWFWKKSYGKLTAFFRAIDTLFSISSRLSFKQVKVNSGIVEIPASRFFRPYSEKEKIIQKLKMNRIKNEMLQAAKKGENYHLWWHPHNFGDFPQENMEQLREILEYYQFLNVKYGFISKNMNDFVL